MEKASLRLPKKEVDAATATKILAKRFEYDLKEKFGNLMVLCGQLCLSKKVQLANPTYSFVTVSFVDDILEVAELATPDVQTISLSMPHDTKVKFAEIASLKGAIRFPDIGRMTTLRLHGTGIFLMDRLVRFISLGGPMV